ncbi:hypothetical protein KAH94_05620, partial [bacterium]|nr:hypothetical protein [bacterium]
VNKSTQQGNLKEIMTSWNSKDMIKGQREIVEKEFEEKLFSFKNKKKCVNICIFDNLLIVAIELQNRDSIGKGKVNLFAKRLVQSGSLVCFEYIKRQMCYFGSSSDEQLALKSGVIHSTRYELYNCFRNWYLNEWLCETNEPTIKEQLIKNKNFTDLIIYNKRN